MSPLTVFTVGHSTRPIEEFVEVLLRHGIAQVVDVRTVPRSRHNPQYEQGALAASLAEAGIGYVHLPSLGGLRPKRPDSPNGGWRNQSFRNYADYMRTPAFVEGVEELLRLAAARSTAIMCAEAVPWRCHRSLVGDALLVRGVRVLDILSTAPAREHVLTSFAVVRGVSITYPA